MNKDNEQREISRPLKFRVWNGAEMVYDVTVGKFGVFYVNPTNNGLDPKDSASITPFTTKYHEGTPVMQFTGLLDKSGKEIYEGDRIRVERFEMVGYAMSSSGYTDTPDEIYEDCIASVIYSGVSFSFESITCGTVPLDAVLSSNIEVIGNIYSSEPIVK